MSFFLVKLLSLYSFGISNSNKAAKSFNYQGQLSPKKKRLPLSLQWSIHSTQLIRKNPRKSVEVQGD